MSDMLARVEAALTPFFCSSDRTHGQPREAGRAALKALGYDNDSLSSLQQMVALDEELERKHPGWMTG